jgi:ribosomal protein S18 acetylase RimI-like enzyme
MSCGWMASRWGWRSCRRLTSTPGARDDALYLHGLRVLRAYAGQGIGRAILRWAEGRVAARGRIYLRLDCMADNAKLRAYYEEARFRYVGEQTDEDEPDWRASLYEKRVAVT